MLGHLRANLLLLVLTVLICSVLYPLVLLGIGKAFFRHQAEGSLIDEKGNPVTDPSKARGSLLIGQQFKGDEYFQPRPSNAGIGNGYDASASGASNWGASNPLLRSRVARQLGPIVKYSSESPTKPGQRVAGDIEDWFKTQVQKNPQFVALWAKTDTSLAEQWIKDKDNEEAVAKWIEKNPGDPKEFFASFAAKHPGTWPAVEDKVIKPVQSGPHVQGYFFDRWLQANRDAFAKGTMILEKVPADMVMASGSGLDPHITLKSALYQLDRVAGKWAEKKSLDRTGVRKQIESMLREKAEAPLGGLVGVDLVNVLEVNLALRQRYLPAGSN